MNRTIAILIAALALAATVRPAVASDAACGVVRPLPAKTAPAPLIDGPVLTIEVRDAVSEAPVAARVGVWDGGGVAVSPPDPEGALFQSLSGKTHFYSDGAVALVVPAGNVTVRAGCGFEYVPEETTLSVAGDTTVVLSLERVADMNAAGWYAADTHAHISHPPVIYAVDPEQVITVMEAEGLNVVNSMEEQPYFTGALHPSSTPDRLLYFSKEERNAHFGHLSLVGLKQWIPDQTCDELDHTCGRTLTRHIADTVHAQGDHTLVIATHPFPTWNLYDITPWPGGGVWRGMPVDLLGGHVDAVDVLNYTHALPPAGVEDYFHALNLGFRVPPSAGSDAILGNGVSRPVGGYRVYTNLGGEPFTFENWVDAFRAGRSFVSNYPLITAFAVGGAEPGDDVEYGGAPLPAHIAVDCARPFSTVEIVAGGVVIHTIDLAPGTTHLEASFDVDPAGAGWIAARVKGASGGWHVVDANGLFALTAPVYVTQSAAAPAPPASPGLDPVQLATYRFFQFTEDIIDVFDLAEFTPQGRAEFDSMTAYAIDYYLNAWPDPPNDFNLVSPLNVSWHHGRTWVQTLTPTFRWRRASDPDPGDTVTYEFQLDTDYAFADPETTCCISDTVFTAPLEYGLVDQGIYYWRVYAVDALGNRRLATPGWWTFVIDMLATPAGDGPPRSWALRSAYPNPFNPVVRIDYAVPLGARDHRLAVFDAAGRHVATLFEGSRAPGVYHAAWDGTTATGGPAASGVYFIRLHPAGHDAVTRKVVLVK